MLIPVRCFSCNKVVGNKQIPYEEMISQGIPAEEALNLLGLKRYCCRRMVLTYVDVTGELSEYSVANRG